MPNGEDSQKKQVFNFTLNKSQIRQIDLAEPSPNDLAKQVQAKLNKYLKNITITDYEMYWWSFNNFAGSLVEYAPHLMPYIKMIADEMYKAHYGEAAIRLGIVNPNVESVSPNVEPAEVKEDGLPSETDSSIKERASVETPTGSRIVLLE